MQIGDCTHLRAESIDQHALSSYGFQLQRSLLVECLVCQRNLVEAKTGCWKLGVVWTAAADYASPGHFDGKNPNHFGFDGCFQVLEWSPGGLEKTIFINGNIYCIMLVQLHIFMNY